MEKESLLELDFIKESNPVKECLAIKTNKEKCDAHTIGDSQYCKRHLNLINKHKKLHLQQLNKQNINTIEITEPLLEESSEEQYQENETLDFTEVPYDIEINNSNENTETDKASLLTNINIDKINKDKKKKRGRRRKIDISDNFYNEEYITVWPEIIDGKKLLIDNDNNVYTFNLDNPIYLGKKTLNCKIIKP